MVRIVVTFGSDHTHPASGRNMRDGYVVVEAETYEIARAKVIERFGTRWSFDYMDRPGGSTAESQAGVGRFGLVEIDFDTGLPK